MIRAKKSLGQNFLNSEEIAEEIVKTADIQAGDVILEIGPGTGVLTEKILKECQNKDCKIIAVEKDDNLAVLLNKKFSNEIKKGGLEIINGDILDLNIKNNQLLQEKYKIIANIPYYITGQIIRKFLSSQNQPSKMVLMVQKEVAERIVAKDGKESILSISVKVYGKPRYIKIITADNFSPRPKVDSAILLIDDISKDFFKNIDEEKFFELIKTGFSSKRKTLSNNLKNKMSEIQSNSFVEILQKIGLSEKVRAENLSINGWNELYKNLYLKG